jgi:hypothetical protein
MAHYAFSASLAATAVLAWQLNAKPIMLDSDASSSIKCKICCLLRIWLLTLSLAAKPKARPVAEKEKPVGKSEFVAEDPAPSETPATEPSKPAKTDAIPSSSTSAETPDHDHSHPADHPHDHPHEPEGDSSEPSSGGAANQGAYNPETGEINWDCPCLGGMAHGPCGPQFREAFSCFIYSEAEPKGIECVEKFKGMQDCFREHPEVYAAGMYFPSSKVMCSLNCRNHG